MVSVTTTDQTTTRQGNPFYVMVSIYLFIAIFTSFGSFLSILNIYIVPGISWIRIHVITLGVTLQFLMGYLPKQVAKNQVSTRWDIFVILNTGILVFLTGRTLENQETMLIGGIILFVATLLFAIQLLRIDATSSLFVSGKIFYLTGVSYFFLGILMGTGIWLNWGVQLHVKNILEVHIHANNWGLISFVFAGLFIDNYEHWFDRSLKWPRSIPIIYTLLLVGTFGLVVGPWTGSIWLIVPGLVAHLVGTVLFLLNLNPSMTNDDDKTIFQVISAYLWFFAPVFVSPLVLMKLPGIPSATIEGRAPEALIFGWLLPTILFFYLNATKLEQTPVRLHGLTTVLFHFGGLSLWIGIFTNYIFYSLAYLFWALALASILLNLIRSNEIE